MENKLSKSMWLLETILQAGQEGITREQINEKWKRHNNTNEELPRRSFNNYLDFIEEFLSLDIECNRSTNRYYVQHADQIKNNELNMWVMNSLSLNSQLETNNKLRKVVRFEEGQKGSIFISTILKAIAASQQITIHYNPFNKDSYDALVEPYALKHFKQRWYMVAIDTFHNDYRIFALDRISQVTTSDNRFQPRKDFSIDEYFKDFYGITADRTNYNLECVQIRVFGLDVKYMKSMPLHATQTIIEENSDNAVFQYYIYPTYDFQQELQKFGDQVEVLHPTWLRDVFRDRVRRQLERYNG